MAAPSSHSDAVFRLSPRIDLFPVLHGSGDVAQEVRDRLTGEVVRVATAYLNAAEQGEAGVSHELRRRIDRALAGGLS